MKCKDFEQDIYLYSELTETERIRVDAHIQKCDACKELFQLVSTTHVLIEQVSLKKPEIANHGKLTSDIMQAIQSKYKEESILISLLQRSFVKYSFVATSLALSVLFVTEQQHFSEPQKTVVTGVVTLKSTTVSEVFEQRKESKVSLYACIKTDGCGNAIIENLKQKNF